MQELIKKIKNNEVILFVGAGVSATLNLPTWSQLMDYLAENLGFDSSIFKLYGDNLMLAEYYKLEKRSLDSLRSWMEQNWNVEDEIIKNSEILEQICKLKFPIVYTTNYDNCLERAFEIFKCEYSKILNVEDLCKIEAGKTQIVKFHGDFEDDDSIILTESSYFNRMDFESPLDIKLRADSLSKSILFIGYSLSDINMRYLIYRLNKIWDSSRGTKGVQPKSYLFMTTPNPIQEKILSNRNIISIVGTETNPTDSLSKFLKDLVENI